MLYSLFLKLLYPTSLCVICLVASAVLQRRHTRKLAKQQAELSAGSSEPPAPNPPAPTPGAPLPAPRSDPPAVRGQWSVVSSPRLARAFRTLAVLILLICGNGWLVRAMVIHLESQNLPPEPVPQADCILILGGGVSARIPPRPTVEVSEAGDRVLYGAHLFKQGKAPRIVCTGGVATGGIALRPGADEMAELLENLGVPKAVIVTETGSENTHQHGSNLQSLFREQSIKRVLLVTSAMHMPRSLGVFRRSCPDVEFIAAPTDFRVTQRIPAPWYRELISLIPTPSALVLFSEAMHEYLGLTYYRLRGWA